MHLIVTPLPSPRHFVTSFRLSRASPSFFFFFNDTATTEIYTLSLHDALPISNVRGALTRSARTRSQRVAAQRSSRRDRKSTRLNSSHLVISYAVFCLKKKKANHNRRDHHLLRCKHGLQPSRQRVELQHRYH